MSWRMDWGRSASIALAVVLVGAPAFAQDTPPGPPAPTGLLLPNYTRILVGEHEALEAGAFVGRAEGPIAVFYNPAGLGLISATKVIAGLSTQEWMTFSVEGTAATTAGTTNRSIGGAFGIALGPDVARFEKWRFGLLVAQPLYFEPRLEFRTDLAPGTRATFIGSSSLSDLVAAIGAGYNQSRTLRFGVSVGLSMVSMSRNQTTFIDLASATTLRSVQSTVFGDGTVWSAVVSGGVQWEPSPRVAVGAKVTLPSWRLGGSSSLIFREAGLAGGGGRIATHADESAELRYVQPFSLHGGVAWRFARGAVEFDVKQFFGTSAYAVLSSSRPVEVVTVSGAGTVVEQSPLPEWTYGGEAVTDVALGGHVRVNSALTLHGGFYTDRSPVPEDQQVVFDRMHLTGVTGGAALSVKGLVASVGLARIWGERRRDLELATGVVAPTVRVSSIQLLYAVSFSF